MKKNIILKILILAFLVCTVLAIFTACDFKLFKTESKNIYTVKFDTKGGTVIPDQKIEEGGYITEVEDPTKEGVDFYGWYLDENTPADFTKPVVKDMTIYAKWGKIAKTVKFVQDGKTDERKALNGYVKNVPEIIPIEGYTVRWKYINGDKTTLMSTDEILAYYFDNDSEEIACRFEVDKKANVYKATYTLGEGESWEGKTPQKEGDVYYFTFTYGSEYELPKIKKDAGIFIGYCLDGKDLASSGVWNIAKDVTLTTKWENVKINVIYRSNRPFYINGSSRGVVKNGSYYTFTEKVEYGSVFNPQYKLSSGVFVFKDWVDVGGNVFIGGMEIKQVEDLILTARWESDPDWSDLY